MNKRILMISPSIPCPNGNGFQLLSYDRILSYKSNNFDVIVICHALTKLSSDNKNLNNLQKLGVDVFLINISLISSFISLILGFLIGNTPLQVLIYRSSKFKKIMIEVIKKYNPDLIHFITIRVFNEKLLKNIPFVTDFIDSMYLNFYGRIKNSNFIMKLVLNNEIKRLKAFEKHVAQLSLCSFIVSDIDSQSIDSNKIMTIPLGLNFDKIRINKIKNIKKNYIIFSGNMNYSPNVEAIKWFYYNCWKYILNKKPKCQLLIVGRKPHKSIQKLMNNEKNIIITGEVPSIYDYLKESSISIAPMQSGSGMQNKIIEAMAIGIPVITTSLGLGDLYAKKNEEIIIADTPLEFCKNILKLLENNVLKNKIGLNGKKYVYKNHDNLKINNIFIKKIYSILNLIKHTN